VDRDAVYKQLVPEVLSNIAQWILERETVAKSVLNTRFYSAFLVAAACTGRRAEELMDRRYEYRVVDKKWMVWDQLAKQRGNIREVRTPLLADGSKLGMCISFIRDVVGDNPRGKRSALHNWLKLNHPEFAGHSMRRAIYARQVYSRRTEFGYNEGTTFSHIRREVLGHLDYNTGANYSVSMSFDDAV
jgi:hypothetical protein